MYGRRPARRRLCVEGGRDGSVAARLRRDPGSRSAISCNSRNKWLIALRVRRDSRAHRPQPRPSYPSLTTPQPHPARPSTRPGPDGPARPGPYPARLRPATPRPPRPTRPRRRSGPFRIRPEPKRRCRPNRTTAIPCPSRAGAEQLPSGPSPSRWPLPSHTCARRRSRAGRSRPGGMGASTRDSDAPPARHLLRPQAPAGGDANSSCTPAAIRECFPAVCRRTNRILRHTGRRAAPALSHCRGPPGPTAPGRAGVAAAEARHRAQGLHLGAHRAAPGRTQGRTGHSRRRRHVGGGGGGSWLTPAFARACAGE